MTHLVLAALIMSAPIKIKGEAAAVSKIASDMRFMKQWACESADVDRINQVLLIIGGIGSIGGGILHVVLTPESDYSIGTAVVPVIFSVSAILQFVVATQHSQAAEKAESVCRGAVKKVGYQSKKVESLMEILERRRKARKKQE